MFNDKLQVMYQELNILVNQTNTSDILYGNFPASFCKFIKQKDLYSNTGMCILFFLGCSSKCSIAQKKVRYLLKI